ncbi:hypothetical protein FSOLCH5_004395 [Fusarium solani]
MATIEPRLIHLLNEPTTPQIPHTDLPPLQSLPLPKAADRALPPLEPDTNPRGERPAADTQPIANGVGPIYLGADDGTLDPWREGSRQDGKSAATSGPFPLRLALGDSDAPESSHSISRMLDDSPDLPDDASNKKRHRGLHVKDDFVQLPQPLKKQKAAQQAPVMPPIINGLHEPPATRCPVSANIVRFI